MTPLESLDTLTALTAEDALRGLDTRTLVELAVLGFVAGVGITAIGPGGVLVTIGLFVLTDLDPARVAGTALVTHIATGALATVVCARSGHLADPGTRRTATWLAGTALLGAPVGVLANGVLSRDAFGVLLAGFTATVAALVWYRQRRSGPAIHSGDHPSRVTVAALGLTVATASGIVGVGGPLLTVPLLVALGVPVLSALAAAQVQSVVISSAGTVGYVAAGAVDWPLAALLGVPELAGVVLGWKIARALPTRALTFALIASLLALTPYLALHG